MINLSIKPGTNKLHGAAYEYLRRTDLTANTYANNANNQPRPNRLQDQYGFEIDGPVYLPKMYHGRDRTFFMFAFEKYRDVQPQPGLGAVPTPEQRSGDFSQTFNRTGTGSTRSTIRSRSSRIRLTIPPRASRSRIFNIFGSRSRATRFRRRVSTRLRSRCSTISRYRIRPAIRHASEQLVRGGREFGHGLLQRHRPRGSQHQRPVRFFARWDRNFRDGGKKNAYSWDTNAKQFTHSGRNNDGGVVDLVDTAQSPDHSERAPRVQPVRL